MKIEAHNIKDTNIAEVISEANVINKVEDGIDLLGTSIIRVRWDYNLRENITRCSST